jgi:biopolymer transport protein ExbD
MAININTGDEDEVISSINTTPLVDVMLVLLIIFLITIPIAVQTHKVMLPSERVKPRIVNANDVNLAVDVDGKIFWNQSEINTSELNDRLKSISTKRPQPEIHLRGDEKTEFKNIAVVMLYCQKAGIVKVNFVTQPQPKN